MSTRALDRIIEQVKMLTPEERHQLVELLKKDERTADLRRIQSKYVRMKTSSDRFASRKAEEIEMEDRLRR